MDNIDVEWREVKVMENWIRFPLKKNTHILYLKNTAFIFNFGPEINLKENRKLLVDTYTNLKRKKKNKNIEQWNMFYNREKQRKIESESSEYNKGQQKGTSMNYARSFTFLPPSPIRLYSNGVVNLIWA